MFTSETFSIFRIAAEQHGTKIAFFNKNFLKSLMDLYLTHKKLNKLITPGVL